MCERLFRCIDDNRFIRFVQEFVRIDSVYDPSRPHANESRATVFLSSFLKDERFDVHVEEAAPGRSNVIAVLEGRSPGKTLLFEGHQDVVSVGNPERWRYDPFGAEIVDSGGRKRMYGRGTCDTKGNTAAGIFAVKAIRDSGVPFSGKIVLCLPVDEEGLMIGIKDFIRRGWADDVDAAVICEPEDFNLCVFQKGAMRVRIVCRGTQAHGCMPLSGNDPNWAMARIICDLRNLEDFEKDRLGRHEHLGWPSITPTVVQSPLTGVAQLNVIPEDCGVLLDIRTIPGQDHAALLRQIRGIVDRLSRRHPDGDDRCVADVELLEDRPWTETSRDEPIVRAIDRAHREVRGTPPVYNGVPGATDGTFLSAWKHVPVVVTGAGDREIPHHVDEWVDVDDLKEAVRLYARTAMLYLGEEV
jgi:succinyl-diaminopimelate desuccinylase